MPTDDRSTPPRREGDEAPEAPDAVGPPWRFRGADLSRVLALSDGIFAFAMTLLVLSLVLPAGIAGSAVRTYLLSSKFFQPLYAYLVTFFVITLWWQGHHLVFSYIRRYDRNLIRLNMAFLVFIAVLPFATMVLNAAEADPIGVAVFALLQVGAGLVLGGLWLYASTRGRLVAPNLPRDWVRHVSTYTFLPPLVFAASIPVAFVSTGAAEIVWLGIFVTQVVGRQRKMS